MKFSMGKISRVDGGLRSSGVSAQTFLTGGGLQKCRRHFVRVPGCAYLRVPAPKRSGFWDPKAKKKQVIFKHFLKRLVGNVGGVRIGHKHCLRKLDRGLFLAHEGLRGLTPVGAKLSLGEGGLKPFGLPARATVCLHLPTPVCQRAGVASS